jgi:hypothetical protein
VIVEKMGPVPQPEEDRDHPSHNEHEIEDAGLLTFSIFQ